MIDDERAELLSQITALQERLASYIAVVDDVVERLGHEGSEPGDLLDAIGEIEGMLAGKITNEPHDLAGLAELVRQALWHRDRARLLLADARNTCEQRAAERDSAILERDAVARELARVLAAQTAVAQKFAETDLWIECAEPELKRFWVSWYHPNDAPVFTLRTPWWCSGWSDNAESICAAILAVDAVDVERQIFAAYEGPVALKFRFVEERSDDWSPFCERFERADWMEWLE